MTSFLKLLYFVVSSFFFTGYLITIPFRLIFFSITRNKSKQIKTLQRAGFLIPSPHFEKETIWIHAVSGGEVRAAVEIISRFHHFFFIVTTMSDTGRSMSEKLLSRHQNTVVAYAPFDHFFTAKRFLKKYKPKKIIIIEHDIWPAFLHEAGAQKIRRILLNFEIRGGHKTVLKKQNALTQFIFPLDDIFFQNRPAPEVRKALSFVNLYESGNLKYSLPPFMPEIKLHFEKEANGNTDKLKNDEAFSSGKNRQTVCFGSTHKGEEELFLSCRLPGNPRKIIIPRHPDRTPAIVKTAFKTAETKHVSLWSTFLNAKKPNATDTIFVPPKIDILIVDALGYANLFYENADIVMIGDTFTENSGGGHNFLEPLFFKKPVLYGPYMSSFSDITPAFEQENGVRRIGKTQKSMEQALSEMLLNPVTARKTGENGYSMLCKTGFDFSQLEKII